MITFREPFNIPYNYAVQLRNPTLGDSNEITTGATFKQAMNGDIHSHIKTKSYRLLLTFITLTKTERDNFLDFFDNVIGKEIRYEDYNGQVWRGYFNNTGLQFTTIRDECSYNCTVEFVGSLT